jgi:hypothetical protein
LLPQQPIVWTAAPFAKKPFDMLRPALFEEKPEIQL